eukprot:TRINITY_DN9396_c0_g1_i1.p1 TRINITY_DN9396_c0_g1~~TRINITY_DN9396_c0_g1_i1.p1  ORF type:complete len:318 (-),score=64.97 TRINITY_DN9396_c0_g1_i1:233-1186(-)
MDRGLDAAMDELDARTAQLSLTSGAGDGGAVRGREAAGGRGSGPASKDTNTFGGGGAVAAGGGDVQAESDDRVGSIDADEESSSELSASDEDSTWISWFVSLRGNEFFCEVDEEYIQDDFNLTGLSTLVPYYDYALDMILDVEVPTEQSLTEEQQEVVESAAEMLYGLIHARFILTTRGMQGMLSKYQTGAFGRCPRIYCQGQNVLPVGLSDVPRSCTVAVYCPRCQDIFHPKSTRQANVDGAYFGTTFPHLFLLTHPDVIPARPSQSYVPRVYGFRINAASAYYRNNRRERASEDSQSGSARTRRERRDGNRGTPS